MAEVQGFPVPGLRRYGIPPGGAFDEFALRRLIGLTGSAGQPESENAFAIEFAGGWLELESESGFSMAFLGLACEVPNSQPLSEGEIIWIEPGSKLRLSVKSGFARGWAVLGGGLIGAQAGQKLVQGDVLEMVPMVQTIGRRLAHGGLLLPAKECALRFIPSNAWQGVDWGPWQVGLDSNRVGIRLSGHSPKVGRELDSEPVAMGVMQNTPSGELVILGPDGPTIGGYERVGTVIQADFPKLAQLKPFDKVSFKEISYQEAIKAFNRLTDRINTEARLMNPI